VHPPVLILNLNEEIYRGAGTQTGGNTGYGYSKR
jgi:hypothetical protein